jgi:6-phosphogluconate dehydrogenase
MLPAGTATETALSHLQGLMSEGDVIVDGANSFYKDSVRRAATLRRNGLGFVDCGVSGGVHGLANGYCLMAGGDEDAVERVRPYLRALAPAPDTGWLHAGPAGAGHYVKMVHNGIEYGMMQAFAEGYELLEKKDIIKDVHGTFAAWQRGTVVRSWLLDLLVIALEEDPHLANIRGYVEDSGEGRWTVEEGIANSVPMPVITASLFTRFASRQDDSPAMKAVAALRNQFGGHAVKKAE